MALIKCTECWNNVSEKAENCPHCGAKIKEEKKRKISFQTICTTVTSILSVYVAIQSFIVSKQSFNVSEQSFNVSEQSLDVSKQALDISQIALKSSSTNSEPLLKIDIDRKNKKITIKHETHDIYKIRCVMAGKVKTLAVTNKEISKISAIELYEEYNAEYLENGNIKRFNHTEEEIKKLNKELEISLTGNLTPESTKQIKNLKAELKSKIKNNKNIQYWETSSYFNYYYIEIIYYDIYSNTHNMYYIYKKDYAFHDWRIHKLTKKEYTDFTKDIQYYDINLGKYQKSEDKKIIDKLISNKNFKDFNKSKYNNFWEPFPFSQ